MKQEAYYIATNGYYKRYLARQLAAQEAERNRPDSVSEEDKAFIKMTHEQLVQLAVMTVKQKFQDISLNKDFINQLMEACEADPSICEADSSEGIRVDIPWITDPKIVTERKELSIKANSIICGFVEKQLIAYMEGEGLALPRGIQRYLRQANTPENKRYNEELFRVWAIENKTSVEEKRRSLTGLLLELTDIDFSDFRTDVSDEELLQTFSDPAKYAKISQVTEIESVMDEIERLGGIDSKLTEAVKEVREKLMSAATYIKNRIDLIDNPVYAECEPEALIQSKMIQLKVDPVAIDRVFAGKSFVEYDEHIMKNGPGDSMIDCICDGTLFGPEILLNDVFESKFKECTGKSNLYDACDKTDQVTAVPSEKPIKSREEAMARLNAGEVLLISGQSSMDKSYVLRMDKAGKFLYGEAPDFVAEPIKPEAPVAPVKPVEPVKPGRFAFLLDSIASVFGLTYGPVDDYNEEHNAWEKEMTKYEAKKAAYETKLQEYKVECHAFEAQTRLWDEQGMSREDVKKYCINAANKDCRTIEEGIRFNTVEHPITPELRERISREAELRALADTMHKAYGGESKVKENLVNGIMNARVNLGELLKKESTDQTAIRDCVATMVAYEGMRTRLDKSMDGLPDKILEKLADGNILASDIEEIKGQPAFAELMKELTKERLQELAAVNGEVKQAPVNRLMNSFYEHVNEQVKVPEAHDEKAPREEMNNKAEADAVKLV